MIEVGKLTQAKSKMIELKNAVNDLDDYEIKLLKSIEAFLKNNRISDKQLEMLDTIHQKIFDTSWNKTNKVDQMMDRLAEKFKEQK